MEKAIIVFGCVIDKIFVVEDNKADVTCKIKQGEIVRWTVYT